ncbi:hypothetical protein B0H12DRAFT_970226, partial [Mycena haematopus]
MRRHYLLYLQGIREHYLGRNWQRKMNRDYELQRFRQKGHETESPRAYVGRRIMWTRMLVATDDGGPLEVFYVMDKAPVSWGPILILENINSTMSLYSKVVEHEAALVNASRSEHSRALTAESLGPALRALGINVEKPRLTHKQVHFGSAGNSEEQKREESPNLGVDSNPAEEEVFRQVYATLQAKKQTPPPGGYPFPKNDNVVTKMGRLPPGPCRLCGSEKHWNKECPHYVVYSESSRRNVNFAGGKEPSEEETMYQSLFTILLNQAVATADFSTMEGSFFDEAALKDRLSTRKTAEETGFPERTSKNQTKTPKKKVRIEEVEDEDEERDRQKPKATEGIIELAEEGSKETKKDRAYHRAEEFCISSEHELELEGSREEHEAFISLADSKAENLPLNSPEPTRSLPRNPQTIRLSKRRKAKPGRSALGTSVLSMRGRAGTKDGPEIDLRVDT